MSRLELVNVVAEAGAFRLGPIRLTAAPGEATVLLGPSGAGKTTLLRAVAGFLPLRQGSVLLDGDRIDGLPPHRRGLGFVPPDLGLFGHRRVRRNVGYPLELTGAPEIASQTDRWLARFGLSHLADRYPAELSSGERQRVAMARALAAGPRLLLWDEPFSALDVESRDVLLRLVRELVEAEGLPLLLVTHDPTVTFAVASHVVVLEGGGVRFDGPPDRLAAGPLDRFTARFLGYENLYAAGDLDRVADPSLARTLRTAAGPEGLVVPAEAVRWSADPSGAGSASVASVRWTAAGWVVAVRDGSLVFRARAAAGPPGVRVGDRVGLAVDPAACRPLGAAPLGGPR